MPDISPKDRFVTVYGRKPVLEALADDSLIVDKVILAESARGPAAAEILRAAGSRGVPVQRASAHRVKVLAGNGKQDQGVLADVVAPRMRPLTAALSERPPRDVLVLDGITTPANVGMIIRTAVAAGVGGIVLPRRGVASLDPLVVKSSAGVAFRAPLLRCATAFEGISELRSAGYRVFGLDGRAESSVFESAFPARSAFVLGGESTGVGSDVRGLVHQWVRIPMAGGVESLNVASAAAVLCFELVRRAPGERRADQPAGRTEAGRRSDTGSRSGAAGGRSEATGRRSETAGRRTEAAGRGGEAAGRRASGTARRKGR